MLAEVALRGAIGNEGQMLMTLEHEHVHNVVLDDGSQGREYRNGRGKIIRLGDMVKADGKAALYRVLDLRVEDGRIYVTAYGGPKGRLNTRTFHVDRCSRVVAVKDDVNEGLRHAVHEAAQASKSKKRGWQ
jgi:hydrogenase maturation factor